MGTEKGVVNTLATAGHPRGPSDDLEFSVKV